MSSAKQEARLGAVVIKGELIEASPAIGNAGGYVSNSYPYTDRCESCVVAFHTYYPVWAAQW